MEAQQCVELTRTNEPIGLTFTNVLKPTSIMRSLPLPRPLDPTSPMRHRVKNSGDHSGGATPVPIPNTVVKPVAPMVLVAAGRVGHRPNSFTEAPDAPVASGAFLWFGVGS